MPVNRSLLPASNSEPWYENCLEPVVKWTWFHYIYVILGQGVISAGVSFGINYGLAILVFRGKPPPTLWYFPLPMAGDYGVLTIIETLSIFLLSGTLIMLDVKKGMLASLDPRWLNGMWPSRKSWIYWYLRPPELCIDLSSGDDENIETATIASTSSKSSASEHSASYKYGLRVYHSVQRAIPWIVLGFFAVWPWFIIGTYLLYGNDNYNSDPQPEYLSAAIGAVLALVLTPCLCVVVLTFLGDQILLSKGSMKLASSGVTMNPMYTPTETDTEGFAPNNQRSSTTRLSLPAGFSRVEGVTFLAQNQVEAPRTTSGEQTQSGIGLLYTSSTLTLLQGSSTVSNQTTV